MINASETRHVHARAQHCVLGWGTAFVLAGLFLIWTGLNTPPGEPALQIPRRPDWSATEAKVIGACACVLGVYVAIFLGRKRTNKRAA